MENEPMKYSTGINKNFYWFETSELSLGKLIHQLPQLFLQKYLVNAYFDGSPLELEAIKIIDSETLDKLPTDNHDQWILTQHKPKNIKAIDYVNFTYFSLIDWDEEVKFLQDEDEINFIMLYSIDRNKLKRQFWKELEKINPYNFISDGSKLVFVTKNEDEIQKIENHFCKNQK